MSRPCISGVLHRESTILKSAMMPVKLVCRRIHGENPHAHPPATGKKETREDRAEEEEERVESINTHTVFFLSCLLCAAMRRPRVLVITCGPRARMWARVSACACPRVCVHARVSLCGYNNMHANGHG